MTHFCMSIVAVYWWIATAIWCVGVVYAALHIHLKIKAALLKRRISALKTLPHHKDWWWNTWSCEDWTWSEEPHACIQLRGAASWVIKAWSWLFLDETIAVTQLMWRPNWRKKTAWRVLNCKKYWELIRLSGAARYCIDVFFDEDLKCIVYIIPL